MWRLIQWRGAGCIVLATRGNPSVAVCGSVVLMLFRLTEICKCVEAVRERGDGVMVGWRYLVLGPRENPSV